MKSTSKACARGARSLFAHAHVDCLCWETHSARLFHEEAALLSTPSSSSCHDSHEPRLEERDDGREMEEQNHGREMQELA